MYLLIVVPPEPGKEAITRVILGDGNWRVPISWGFQQT